MHLLIDGRIRPQAKPIRLVCVSCVISCLVYFLSSCTHTQSPSYGLKPAYKGFVPGQIAVMPCSKPLVFDLGAGEDANDPTSPPATDSSRNRRYVTQAVAQPDIAETLCQELDGFVRRSFEGQPYTKGYSPKAVVTRLQQRNQLKLGLDLCQLLSTRCRLEVFLDPSVPQPSNDQLKGTQNLQARQASSQSRAQHTSQHPDDHLRLLPGLRDNPRWVSTLNAMSLQTKYSDTLLLPFVLYATSKPSFVGPTAVLARRAAVSIWLVDTNTGELIWSGYRSSQINDLKTDDALSPEQRGKLWRKHYGQLFHEALWQDFPGRVLHDPMKP